MSAPRLDGIRPPGGDERVDLARAWWSLVTEPGDRVAGALVRALGPVAALEAARHDDRDRAASAGLRPAEWAEAVRRWRPRDDADALRAALDAARRGRVRLLTPDDPAWPARLDDLGLHAPHCLWLRGADGLLGDDRPSVAIVGARAATGYGEHVAAELAAELGGAGVRVVSGAAYGIDGAAHRAALAAGGETVALLAGGADRAYPAGHTELIDRIADRGVVVSEVPCGAAPTKWRFLARNRVIAALADAVVVVEAGWRSGSLNTAGHAAELGRPLGAVPGPVTSAASAGCHRLLREYDAVCITGADDVRELLGLDAGASADAAASVDPALVRMLDALSARTPSDLDALARVTGLSREHAQAVLGAAALEGRVVADAGGWRRVPA